MSHKTSIGFIVACMLFSGCSAFDFSKSLTNIAFWNAGPENYDLVFEVLDDDETLSDYLMPGKSLNADDLVLDIDTSITRSNHESLSAKLTNNRTKAIQLLNPGSLEGDHLVEFLAIEKNGTVVHRFGPFRIYSRESVGTFGVAPGDHYQKTISIDVGSFQASFESIEFNKPIELVIVAKFEQSAAYGQPQIGPIYSLPKKFRVTKYKVQ